MPTISPAERKAEVAAANEQLTRPVIALQDVSLEKDDKIQQLEADANRYSTNTDGFGDQSDTAHFNRSRTRTLIVVVLILAALDAVLATSGIARSVVESISVSFTPNGAGLVEIPSWLILLTSTALALALWAITLLLKFGTDTTAELDELGTTESLLAASRLRRRIWMKRGARAVYLLMLGMGLHSVHEDASALQRQGAEFMQDMKRQSEALYQAIGSTGFSVSPPSAVSAPAAASIQVTSVGAGPVAFVLAVLWALHLGVLCSFPAFSPVNPFSERPFQVSWATPRAAQLRTESGRELRHLWDMLQALPPELRQERINVLPRRLAALINEEIGEEVIVVRPKNPPPPPHVPPPVAPPDVASADPGRDPHENVL